MSTHWAKVPWGTPDAIVGVDEKGEECCWALTQDKEDNETHGVVEDTLTERGKNYGDFTDNAHVAQRLKLAMRNSPKWSQIREDYILESLDLIASKIGRLLSGNSYHIDSWHDIAGYATLVEQRLNKRS